MGSHLNVSTMMMCPHGGQVSAVTTNTQVMVGGSLAVGATDTFLISGCPFTIPPGVPHPCVMVQWVQSAMQSSITGNPTLTEDSVGLCVAVDQTVQGSVSISYTQSQVSGQ